MEQEKLDMQEGLNQVKDGAGEIGEEQLEEMSGGLHRLKPGQGPLSGVPKIKRELDPSGTNRSR